MCSLHLYMFPARRRYRDRWNRILVRRIAKTRNHTLKVKSRVRSRGARTGWWTEHRTLHARRNSRTQCLWTLHIAGDFHPDFETARHVPRPHMMRAMLVSNLAVEQRFANGTFKRIRLALSPYSTFRTFYRAAIEVRKGGCCTGIQKKRNEARLSTPLTRSSWHGSQKRAPCKNARCFQILTRWT